jgi:hypothetical protein
VGVVCGSQLDDLDTSNTSSDVMYQGLKAKAAELIMPQLLASEAVSEAIGTPFTTDLLSREWEENSSSGRAEFSLRLTGPKGSGRTYAKAMKELGQWRILGLIFETPTNERIDLSTSDGLSAPSE